LLTYNGEVYNYRSVRARLEGLGERFETASDTEVVLKAYATWGSDALSYLDGIFAFAVVDTNRRELFLARDRLGVKPLYYAAIDGGIAFASEVKSLLANPLVDRSADLTWVPYYLAFGYFPGS